MYMCVFIIGGGGRDERAHARTHARTRARGMHGRGGAPTSAFQGVAPGGGERLERGPGGLHINIYIYIYMCIYVHM